MVKDIIFRYVRDDGREFVLDGTEYFIKKIDGLDLRELDLAVEPLAFRHGGIVAGARIPERPIVVEFQAFSTADEVREVVRNFFNPFNTYKLHVTYKTITRWIDGKLEGMSEPTETNYKETKCKIGLLCEDPFFKGGEGGGGEGRELDAEIPMWGFPYIATAGYTPAFSRYSYGEYVWFDNDGDVDATFSIRIKFDGTVVNPTIWQGYRDAGIRFKLEDTFVEGDEVFVDFDKQILLKNGVSAWNIAPKENQTLYIKRGGDYISVTCDSGETLFHPTIYFNERYTGM